MNSPTYHLELAPPRPLSAQPVSAAPWRYVAGIVAGAVLLVVVALLLGPDGSGQSPCTVDRYARAAGHIACGTG